MVVVTKVNRSYEKKNQQRIDDYYRYRKTDVRE